MSRRGLVVTCLTCALATLGGDVAHAYLRISALVGTRRVFARWSRSPVPYVVNQKSVPGVTAAELEATIERAFKQWQDVPTASVSFQYAGPTTARPGRADGLNTVGFLDAPELEGVLGVTAFIIDVASGDLVEADMFFNTAFDWSVNDKGAADRFDLESVAVHEAGHFLGLDHSALGYFETRAGEARLASAESVMFPFAFDAGNTALRTLRPDDIAGVSEVYPEPSFAGETGVLMGRIRKASGGVFGAHVMAFNPQTGSMIAGFSLTADGSFTIAGLQPGRYVVRVEPIDDEDVGSFFEEPPVVDVSFRTLFHDRFVGVPLGGGSAPVEIQVQPR